MKKNKKIILILTFALLLTQFGPLMDIIKGAGSAAVIEENFPNKNLSSEVVNAEGSILKDKVQIEAGQVSFDGGTTKYHNKTYDGMEFIGEVEGNNLITYDKLIEDLGITEGRKPTINRTGYEEIYDKYQEEMAKGGIWLKFVDHKYTRGGKPRTFYVMKKPGLWSVSWNTLHTAGAVYGWDVVGKDGLPKTNPEKYKNIGDKGTNKDYKATILTINGEKYIVRLLQGKTNYGGDVTNTRFYQSDEKNANSEWNRVMLPITKDYRFGGSNSNNYIENALCDKNGDNYKILTANYNWFRDLLLGAADNWVYNGKDMNALSKNVYAHGQLNWVQEYGKDSKYRSYLGNGSTYSCAAGYYFDPFSNNNDSGSGTHLVIEPYDSGIEYGSIKFRKIEDDGEEPEEGKVELGRYDDMAFFGEVSGKNLIKHEDLVSQLNASIGGSKPSIPRDGYEEIFDKNKEEEDKGGVWLKFVDYRQDCLRDGKPRTFYVMKKPIRKGVSWDTLFAAGAVYGWDVIDDKNNNSVKPGFGVDSNYKPCIKTINGQQYIVRLLRGVSNYGDSVKYKTGNTIYEWQDAPNSEWNRTMVAITKQYRGEADSMEQELKNGNSSPYKYVTNDYKEKSATYNWFGDLTLGAKQDWTYNNNSYTGLGSNYQGQNSWAQEFCDVSGSRSIRGSDDIGSGAAYSNYYYSNNYDSWRGVRLVLEPLNTNN